MCLGTRKKPLTSFTFTVTKFHQNEWRLTLVLAIFGALIDGPPLVFGSEVLHDFVDPRGCI